MAKWNSLNRSRILAEGFHWLPIFADASKQECRLVHVLLTNAWEIGNTNSFFPTRDSHCLRTHKPQKCIQRGLLVDLSAHESCCELDIASSSFIFSWSETICKVVNQFTVDVLESGLLLISRTQPCYVEALKIVKSFTISALELRIRQGSSPQTQFKFELLCLGGYRLDWSSISWHMDILHNTIQYNSIQLIASQCNPMVPWLDMIEFYLFGWIVPVWFECAGVILVPLSTLVCVRFSWRDKIPLWTVWGQN